MAVEFPDVSNEESRNMFVKIKDGETVNLILRGRLHAYKIHWGQGKSVPCVGKKDCELCRDGNKAKFRFNANVIVKEGSDYVVKIWEQGWTTFEQLREWGKEMDLEITPIKVSRKGSGQNDTTYLMVPLKTITPAQNDLFRAMKLYDLANLDKELDEVQQAPSQDGDFNESDIPF